MTIPLLYMWTLLRGLCFGLPCNCFTAIGYCRDDSFRQYLIAMSISGPISRSYVKIFTCILQRLFQHNVDVRMAHNQVLLRDFMSTISSVCHRGYFQHNVHVKVAHQVLPRAFVSVKITLQKLWAWQTYIISCRVLSSCHCRCADVINNRRAHYLQRFSDLDITQ